MISIAYDVTLMRPGCAIVQAALGATISGPDLARFEPATWLPSTTPAMGVYQVTPEQFEILIQKTAQSAIAD